MRLQRKNICLHSIFDECLEDILSSGRRQNTKHNNLFSILQVLYVTICNLQNRMELYRKALQMLGKETVIQMNHSHSFLFYLQTL